MAESKDNEVFPIKETNGKDKMKNISPPSIPHFHGLTYEDPDTFMLSVGPMTMPLTRRS